VEGGTPFGRYRLLDLLGRGGMGEVWRAFDTATERVVALKVLPTQFADDATYQERFRREARSAAGLDEPHVVPIHDFGEIDGRLYVTMRLINGRDLHTILAEGRLDPARAVGIIDQVASALHAAHQINLIHRDVKPSNILVGQDDFAYLIDFGIARAAGQTGLTSASSVIGTWAYMAPERLTTGHTDARADVYALACVLYECLTGSQPFPGNSLEQQIGGHIAMPPPTASARHSDVPVELDGVIAKGMAKNPDERFATTREMARAAKAAVTSSGTGPNPVFSTTPASLSTPHLNAPPRPPTQPGYVTQRAELASGGPPPQSATPYRPPDGHGPNWPPGAGQGPNWPPGPPPPGWPGQPGSGPPPSKSSRNRLVAISSIAVVAIVAVVAAIIIASQDDPKKPQDRSSGGSSTTTTTSAVPDDGPFTGTFNVDFGQLLLADGNPGIGAPFSESWKFRSECGDNGCVATATSGGQYPTRDLVFDQVDGAWLSVGTGRIGCMNADDEVWNVITLKPQSGGRMTGEWAQATPNGCFNKRLATFTRVSATDTFQLPDPASQPKRVVSPAESLHGQYDSSVLYPSGKQREFKNHFGVQTACLRTADRCMSFFLEPGVGNQPFIFANGVWTRNSSYDAPCLVGGTSHVKLTSTLSLPSPTPDPIPLLTGHGFTESTGSNCVSLSFDQTMTRTGD